MTAHFTLAHKDHAGEYRSNLVAANGEIVAVSEGYTDPRDSERWEANMLRWVVEASEDKIRTILSACLVNVPVPADERARIVDWMIGALEGE